jgi:hypothetical protein
VILFLTKLKALKIKVKKITCRFYYFHPNGGPSPQEHFVNSWAFGKDIHSGCFFCLYVQEMD